MLLNGLLQLKHKIKKSSDASCDKNWNQMVHDLSLSVHTHSLDALLIHTDALKQGFEDFSQGKGKEADSTKLQTMGHLIQDP